MCRRKMQSNPPVPPRSLSDISPLVNGNSLFYTDGLIERRATSISDGLADFAAAAVPAHPDLDIHVARILASAASDTGDDACLMAVRIR